MFMLEYYTLSYVYAWVSHSELCSYLSIPFYVMFMLEYHTVRYVHAWVSPLSYVHACIIGSKIYLLSKRKEHRNRITIGVTFVYYRCYYNSEVLYTYIEEIFLAFIYFYLIFRLKKRLDD